MLANGKVFWSIVEWEDAITKLCGMVVWTARVTKIATSKSWPSWHVWLNQFVEACAGSWYTTG